MATSAPIAAPAPVVASANLDAPTNPNSKAGGTYNGNTGVSVLPANYNYGGNAANATAINASNGSNGTGTPSLIVTSNASRSNYANNVNNLNTANNNLANNNTSNPSIVDFLNANKQPSDFASRTKLAGTLGITNYVGSAAQNGQMLSALQNNGGDNNNSGGKTDTTTTPTTKVTVTNSTSNPDGSTTATNSDGTSTITGANGAVYTAPAGMDPAVYKQLQDNLVQANTDVEQASKAVTAAAALVASDQNGSNPAAVAAAAEIQAGFQTLIQQQTDKNTQLMGRANSAVGAFGGLGVMPQQFLNDETSRGIQALADLNTKMTSAILKSNMGYQSGDLKAFDDAQKEYDTAKTAAGKVLLDLNTSVNNQVKQNQAQAKIDQANLNATIANDTKLSTANAQSIADTIKNSGIKDQATIDAYIQGMADKLGIKNVTALSSAVSKASLSTANTLSTIAKRNSTKTPASGKFNASTAISSVTPQMDKIKGSDGYIDPQKWVQARTNWMSLGGTAASFNSNFKSYLNPASYSMAGFKGTTVPPAPPV